MNCKYCKMEVPEGYRYCPNCGLLLDLGSGFTAPKRNYQIPKYEYRPARKPAEEQSPQRYLQSRPEESYLDAEERLELELLKANEREARAAAEQEKQPTEAVEFSDEEFAQVEQEFAPDAIELEEAYSGAGEADLHEAPNMMNEEETAPERSEAASDAEDNAFAPELPEEALAESAGAASSDADAAVSSDRPEAETAETESAEEDSAEQLPEEAAAETRVEAAEESEAAVTEPAAEGAETEDSAEDAETELTEICTEEAAVAETCAEEICAETAEAEETAENAEAEGAEEKHAAAEQAAEDAPAREAAAEDTDIEAAESAGAAEAGEAPETAETDAGEEENGEAEQTAADVNVQEPEAEAAGEAESPEDKAAETVPELVEAAPEVPFPDDGLDPEKVNKFGNPAFTWDENVSFMEAVSEKSVGDFALEIEEEEAAAEAKAAEIKAMPVPGSVILAAKPFYEGEFTKEEGAAEPPVLAEQPSVLAEQPEDEITEEAETELPAETEITAEAAEAEAGEELTESESPSEIETVEAVDDGESAQMEDAAEQSETESEQPETASAEQVSESEKADDQPETEMIEDCAGGGMTEAAETETESEAEAPQRPKLRLLEDIEAEEELPEKLPDDAEKRTHSKKRVLIPLAVCAVAAGAVAVYLNLPAQRISRALRKSQKLVAENNFSAAVPVLEKVLKDQPEQVEVYLLLSEAYANTDQHAQAVSVLEEAKAAFPDNAELLEKLAALNPTVTISLPSGDYTDPQQITLDSEKGREIRYTLTDKNGTGSEQAYEDAILLSTNGSFTLTAYALASDGAAGEKVEANYTIALDPDKYPLDQFVTTESGTQYLDADGATHVGWLSREDKRYYFDETGYMLTGLQSLTDGTYFFGEDGAMLTGWQEQNGRYYFFDEKGRMLTDIWIDDQYYVGADGAMLTDTTTPDGTYVNARGQKGFDAAAEFAEYPNSIVQVHVSSKVDKGDYYEVSASVYHQKSDNKPAGESYDISLKVSKRATVHYLDNNLPDIIASDAFSFLKEIGMQKIQQDDAGIVTEFSFALGEKRS